MAQHYVLINDDGSNSFFSDDIYRIDDIPKKAYKILEQDYILFFNDNGKYRFVKNGDSVYLKEYVYMLTLEEAQESKLEELSSAAAAAYTEGFISSATGKPLWYDSDPNSQMVINRLFALAVGNSSLFEKTSFMQGIPIGRVPVRTRANKDDEDSTKTVQLLSYDQVITLGNDMAADYANKKGKLWSLQNKVYASTTVGEVNMISW